MAVHRIRKGLNLPIAGAPTADEDAKTVKHAAVVGPDYRGMKPRLLVKEGEQIRRGQPVFSCRRTEGITYTSPAGGRVAHIHRGERRAFESLVVAIEGDEPQSFEAHSDGAANAADSVRALLLEAGLWAALRERPFGKVPSPSADAPSSIFVQAVDSHPLAPELPPFVRGREDDFERGLTALSKLSVVFVCKARGAELATGSAPVRVEEFEGPHPAGSPGLHIHRIDPVDRNKRVWHVGLEDVLTIGRLFSTGELDVERTISLGGPGVKRPRLLRTRMGASIHELLDGELDEGMQRVISGSVLEGRHIDKDTLAYLGRYHRALSVLPEGTERRFMGWIVPPLHQFSVLRSMASAFLAEGRVRFDTNTHGSHRAIVPIGVYEKVMPMDILPTLLCRALLAGDVERAEELGCLELCEEDVGLLSFVDPGKNEFGPALRGVLDQIESSMA